MINNKEKKMIQRYCIYPKIAVVALIFSFVQCALIVPLEMIDDLVFQNKGFQPRAAGGIALRNPVCRGERQRLCPRVRCCGAG